jgi:hypothetical protein
VPKASLHQCQGKWMITMRISVGPRDCLWLGCRPRDTGLCVGRYNVASRKQRVFTFGTAAWPLGRRHRPLCVSTSGERAGTDWHGQSIHDHSVLTPHPMKANCFGLTTSALSKPQRHLVETETVLGHFPYSHSYWQRASGVRGIQPGSTQTQAIGAAWQWLLYSLES